jgi:hypothetical protein
VVVLLAAEKRQNPQQQSERPDVFCVDIRSLRLRHRRGHQRPPHSGYRRRRRHCVWIGRPVVYDLRYCGNEPGEMDFRAVYVAVRCAYFFIIINVVIAISILIILTMIAIIVIIIISGSIVLICIVISLLNIVAVLIIIIFIMLTSSIIIIKFTIIITIIIFVLVFDFTCVVVGIIAKS